MVLERCFPYIHLHTLSTSSVRWQMSRLISDYVLARLHHWSSAAPDCLQSATELFRSPLLVSGAVCLNMSLPHLLWLSSGPVSRHICLTYHIPTPCDCTVPAQWRSLLSEFGHYNRPCYLLTYLHQLCMTWNCVTFAAIQLAKQAHQMLQMVSSLIFTLFHCTHFLILLKIY